MIKWIGKSNKGRSAFDTDVRISKCTRVNNETRFSIRFFSGVFTTSCKCIKIGYDEELGRLYFLPCEQQDKDTRTLSFNGKHSTRVEILEKNAPFIVAGDYSLNYDKTESMYYIKMYEDGGHNV